MFIWDQFSAWLFRWTFNRSKHFVFSVQSILKSWPGQLKPFHSQRPVTTICRSFINRSASCSKFQSRGDVEGSAIVFSSGVVGSSSKYPL
jgi:hypothetical protein